MLRPYEDVEFRLDLLYTRGHRVLVLLTPSPSKTAMGSKSSRRTLLDGNGLAVNGSESIQIDPFSGLFVLPSMSQPFPQTLRESSQTEPYGPWLTGEFYP